MSTRPKTPIIIITYACFCSQAKDDSRFAAACLLICLVGRYFGQADLADPCR